MAEKLRNVVEAFFIAYAVVKHLPFQLYRPQETILYPQEEGVVYAPAREPSADVDDVGRSPDVRIVDKDGRVVVPGEGPMLLHQNIGMLRSFVR